MPKRGRSSKSVEPPAELRVQISGLPAHERLVIFKPCLASSGVMVQPLLSRRQEREEEEERQKSKAGRRDDGKKKQHVETLEDASRWVTKTGMAEYLTLRTRSHDGSESALLAN